MLPNSDPYSDSSQESNYVGIYTFSPYVYNLGFGFDYSCNVFKVLQVLYMSYDSRYSIPVNAQVCTVGCNSWRKLENFPRVRFFGSAPALINGSLHWLSDQHILSFDLGTENFGFVELPPFNLSRGYGYRPYNNYRLVALDRCLSIVDSSFDEDVDLWIMKDYNVKESWIKLIIKRRYVENGVLYQKVLPISFWRKGELLLVYGSKILVSYEIESERYTPFEIEGLLESRSKGSCRYVIFPYVGNVMPIDTTCRMTAQP